MPSKTIEFDPAGGPLAASASAGEAAEGSYGLLLFAPDGLTEVPMPQPPAPSGHFSDPAANTHRLPGSAASNDGRTLIMSYSVGLMDATRAFAVHVAVLQNGSALDTVDDVGVEPGSEDTHDGQFVVRLASSGAALGAAPATATAKKAMKGAAKKAPVKKVAAVKPAAKGVSKSVKARKSPKPAKAKKAPRPAKAKSSARKSPKKGGRR